MGSTLKGKNLLPMEQIVSFKSRPILDMLLQDRAHKSCFVLVKMAEENGNISILLQLHIGTCLRSVALMRSHENFYGHIRILAKISLHAAFHALSNHRTLTLHP